TSHSKAAFNWLPVNRHISSTVSCSLDTVLSSTVSCSLDTVLLPSAPGKGCVRSARTTRDRGVGSLAIQLKTGSHRYHPAKRSLNSCAQEGMNTLSWRSCCL